MSSGEKPPIDPNSLQNMQDRKLAFLNGAVDRNAPSAPIDSRTRVSLRRAGGRRHSGRSHHRHPFRPARVRSPLR